MFETITVVEIHKIYNIHVAFDIKDIQKQANCCLLFIIYIVIHNLYK